MGISKYLPMQYTAFIRCILLEFIISCWSTRKIHLFDWYGFQIEFKLDRKIYWSFVLKPSWMETRSTIHITSVSKIVIISIINSKFSSTQMAYEVSHRAYQLLCNQCIYLNQLFKWLVNSSWKVFVYPFLYKFWSVKTKPLFDTHLIACFFFHCPNFLIILTEVFNLIKIRDLGRPNMISVWDFRSE